MNLDFVFCSTGWTFTSEEASSRRGYKNTFFKSFSSSNRWGAFYSTTRVFRNNTSWTGIIFFLLDYFVFFCLINRACDVKIGRQGSAIHEQSTKIGRQMLKRKCNLVQS